MEIDTQFGPARVVVDEPSAPLSLLVLGHGAGGGIDAPDLVAVRNAAVAASVVVVRVIQPYRVAGRRSPAPARQLDLVWHEVVTTVRTGRPLPVVVGGRSSGARVACRTAAALGAAGVVALAFPLHPPGRPDRSRAAELATGVPTLVVNGDRDPFGVPPATGVDLRVIPGAGHDLKKDLPAVAGAVITWLAGHGWAGTSPSTRRGR